MKHFAKLLYTSIYYWIFILHLSIFLLIIFEIKFPNLSFDGIQILAIFTLLFMFMFPVGYFFAKTFKKDFYINLILFFVITFIISTVYNHFAWKQAVEMNLLNDNSRITEFDDFDKIKTLYQFESGFGAESAIFNGINTFIFLVIVISIHESNKERKKSKKIKT